MLRVNWDDRCNAEWYVERLKRNNGCLITVDDSVKAWFPVDVDTFTRDMKPELLAALNEAFPGESVEFR